MAEEIPCPCNVTPNAGKFGAISAAMNSNIFKNPNAADIAMAKTGFGNNIEKVQGFAAMFPIGGPNPFSGILSQLQASNNLVNQFEVTSNRLSGLGSVLGKPDILAVVSSVALAAKIQCAFGIPGLDVGAAIGAVTGPGKTSVLAAVAASADIGSMLDNLGISPPEGGGIPEIPAEVGNILSTASDALGAVNGAIAGVMAKGDEIYAAAVAVVEQFSTLSATIDILNDPCNKLSVSLGQNIINPEFLAIAKQSNPFAPIGGFPT